MVHLPSYVLTHGIGIPMYRMLRVRHESQEMGGELAAPLMAPHEAVSQGVALRLRCSEGVFSPSESSVQVLHIPVENVQSCFDWVWHGFQRCACRLRWRHLWRIREGIAVDEGVARRPALDFAQSCQISSLKVSVAVLELPHCRIRRSSMEDIADCFRVSLSSVV